MNKSRYNSRVNCRYCNFKTGIAIGKFSNWHRRARTRGTEKVNLVREKRFMLEWSLFRRNYYCV